MLSVNNNESIEFSSIFVQLQSVGLPIYRLFSRDLRAGRVDEFRLIRRWKAENSLPTAVTSFARPNIVFSLFRVFTRIAEHNEFPFWASFSRRPQ